MNKRSVISLLTAVAVGAAALLTPASAFAAETTYIDNSDLVPKYVEDQYVTMEDSGGGLQSPDWVKSLVIAEVIISRATEEGTFQSAVKVLDHYQEMGVNGIWLTPFMDTSQGTGGHYGNFGPHTVDPTLTGKDSYEESWKVVKEFVDEAHKRNIRVFSDMVTWGVEWNAPLYTEKPTWFNGVSAWGGYNFNWSNEEFYNWFQQQLLFYVTDIGFDGFRCDCEPATTGYSMYREVREMALEKGQKIAIFTENTNERLEPAYDFDEHSSEDNTWHMYDLYTEWYDIAESVKKGYGLGTTNLELWDEAGTARFYSFNTSCHDNRYSVNGNMVNFAYQSLLAPFIPIFFMGEEFDNPQKGNSTLFLTPLQLNLLDDPTGENRAFYERVKQMIRIRRLYPEIFEYFPENHRESNICSVEVVGLETLKGYARYTDGKGLLVIPNNNIHDTESAFTIRIPYDDMGMVNNTEYTVTNAITGEVVAKGDRISLYDFQAKVAYSDVGVFMVEPTGKKLAAMTVQNNANAAANAGGALKDTEIVNEENGTGEVLAEPTAVTETGKGDTANAITANEGNVLVYSVVIGCLAMAGIIGSFLLSWYKKRKKANLTM